MSREAVGFRRARRLVGTLAVALMCGAAAASESAPRFSPEDRQRFVSIARGLEQAPLKAGAGAEREWALSWLVDVPDISVTLCPHALGGLAKSKYPHAGELLLQNSFSMAAFLIEHPEAANDPQAQQAAGVEGSLNAYRSILREKPEAKSKDLEDLLAMQSRGELPAFIRKAWARCASK